MKTKSLWLFAAAMLVLIASSVGYHLKQETETTAEYNEKEKKKGRQTGVEKQLAMLYYTRAYPDPYYLGPKYERAWEQAKAIRKRSELTRTNGTQAASWTNIGPRVS